jgi:hypothetical protein
VLLDGVGERVSFLQVQLMYSIDYSQPTLLRFPSERGYEATTQMRNLKVYNKIRTEHPYLFPKMGVAWFPELHRW